MPLDLLHVYKAYNRFMVFFANYFLTNKSSKLSFENQNQYREILTYYFTVIYRIFGQNLAAQNEIEVGMIGGARGIWVIMGLLPTICILINTCEYLLLSINYCDGWIVRFGSDGET